MTVCVQGPELSQKVNDWLIAGKATWTESYTKLLAFNQTQYDRVLSLDSDSTVLQVRCSALALAHC